MTKKLKFTFFFFIVGRSRYNLTAKSHTIFKKRKQKEIINDEGSKKTEKNQLK